jgi:type I restriction enzyme S subunit
MFWSKVKQDLVLPKYLYYTLKTYNLAELNVGSAVPSLTTEVLNKVLISIPEKNTQTSITEILTSLDDKIELNNKINQELETLAQILFKQWFIDFEFPNENGEPYKSSGGKMMESELGMIPKGWGFGSIYEVSNVIYGAPFKSKLFNQEGKGFPLIRIRDMKTFQPQNWTEEVLPKGTKIVAGDLIVGMDAEFRPIFWLGQPAWLNQRLCYFNPKKGFSKLFVREIIRPQLAFFENSSVGTTVIHLGKADIDTFKSIIPEKIIMGLFEEISNSIFEKIINNSKEKNQLTYLRDLLLKKLISGELEINEITN